MKKKIPAWLALGIITLVAGLLLGITNELTKGPIADADKKSKEDARKAVMSIADTFVEKEEHGDLDSFFVAEKNGETVGFVGQATVKGDQGPIEVIAGFDLNGVCTGISVGGSQFSETPGLGAKSKDAKFTDQFKNKTAPVTLTKTGEVGGENGIDQISGATHSSKAVVEAVNRIASFIGETK